MVDRVAADDADGLEALFAEFERLLDEPGTRNLLIVGFLEDLQNVSLNRDLPLDQWTRWLGPNTTLAWRAIEDLWRGEMSSEDFNAFVDKTSN